MKAAVCAVGSRMAVYEGRRVMDGPNGGRFIVPGYKIGEIPRHHRFQRFLRSHCRKRDDREAGGYRRGHKIDLLRRHAAGLVPKPVFSAGDPYRILFPMDGVLDQGNRIWKKTMAESHPVREQTQWACVVRARVPLSQGGRCGGAS